MSERIMHFSLSPVQTFIAQSRRPRDLLASSFLLSYLSGQAMAEIILAGGQIVFPAISSQSLSDRQLGEQGDLLTAIMQIKKGGEVTNTPYIGSLPNRFKAIIPDDFQPEKCVEAVQESWRKIADTVWTECIQPIESYGAGTYQIWQRQVLNYWEIHWVLGEADSLLNQRKYWRTHFHTVEGGDKCILIPDLQEISGHFYGNKQKQFWQKFRDRVDDRYQLDYRYELDEFERLCSIGVIKRFYPKVAKQAIGWPFPEVALHIPSVSSIAALPWLQKVNRFSKEKGASFQALLTEFTDKVQQANLSVNLETKQVLTDLLEDKQVTKEFESFIQLDGTCFYEDSLKNQLEGKAPALRERIIEGYRSLVNEIGGEPTTYYALLLMDGDRLGETLRQGKDSGKWMSRALALFSSQVESIVQSFHGVPIYAGGDDVLALLPLPSALLCAKKLRQAYLDAFAQGAEGRLTSTISAAIVYAHFMSPLESVLQHGRELLDEIAKEQTGRNSLAMSVWNRSEAELTWSAPWQFLEEKIAPDRSELVLEEFTQTDQMIYSNSFIRKIQRLYESAPAFVEDPHKNKQVLQQLVVQDYLRNEAKGSATEKKEIEQKIKILLDLCYRSWIDEDGKYHRAEEPFRADGALFTLFLHQEGGEAR